MNTNGPGYVVALGYSGPGTDAIGSSVRTPDTAGVSVRTVGIYFGILVSGFACSTAATSCTTSAYGLAARYCKTATTVSGGSAYAFTVTFRPGLLPK